MATKQAQNQGITICVRLTPGAHSVLQEMVPYRRGAGRVLSELILAERARVEERTKLKEEYERTRS
jgi:hypothetical protein